MTPDLLRTYDDPFTEAPKIVSFISENTISASWTHDPAADEYILERSEDTMTPLYSVVYRGTGLSFVDTDLPSEIRFLYRLIKVRGKKTFDPSEPAFGVSASVRQDAFENNNTEESATFLESDCISNINYYKAHTGEELIDVDWYYVIVPPHRKACIFITEDANNPLEGTNTHYRVLCRTDSRVINNKNFELENPSETTMNIRFKIYPEPQFFQLSADVGGNTVTYKITLSQIVRY